MTTSVIGNIIQAGVHADIPTLTTYHAGYLYFETDTGKLFRWSGSAWVQIAAGTDATAYTDENAQDAIGAMIADTDTVDLTYTDGTPELKADVNTQMSITSDSSGLKLSGDSATPGNNKVYGTDGSGTKGWKADPAGGSVSDAAYGSGWDGDTTTAPSKNAVYDKIETISGGGRTLISSQSLAGVTSVTFSGISGSYAKLTLEIVARSTQTANGVDLYLQFNSDTTAANYVFVLFRENATGTAAETGQNYTIAKTTIPAASAPSNEYGHAIIELINYADTFSNKKALVQTSGKYDASSVFLQSQSGSMSWNNNSAITAIVVALSAGNGATSSVVNLYGE